MAKQKHRKANPASKQINKTFQPTVKKEHKKNIVLPLLGILALTFFLYLKSLQNGFTNYDDDVLILNNDLVQNLTFGNLYSMFYSFLNGMYHPLVTLSWALEYHFWGDSAYHFHLINLFFHLLNVWLVYRFILLLTDKLNITIIVTLIFALHPMVSESVLWLSERKDLLCYAFMLGGLIHYMKYLKNDLRFKYILLTFIFLLFAVFSKPSAIVFPLLLIAIDYNRGRKITRKNLTEKIPFFLLAILFGIIALLAARSVHGEDILKNYSFLDRIFFVGYAVMFYLYKLIIPVGLSAKHFYPLLKDGLLPAEYYISFVALIFIIISLFRYARKNRELIGGCLFYVASIVIVLPVVPVGDTVAADRYSYISYIGLLLIAGHYYDKFRDTEFLRMKTGHIFKLVIAAFVIFYSVMTYSRNGVWKDSETLWTDVISKDSSASLAYVARGDARAALANYEDASKDYTKAIYIDSTSSIAYNNRGYVNIKTGKYDDAQIDLDQAISLKPKFTKAYYNRSCLYIETKKYKEALTDCDKTIELSPKFAYAYYNRGSAHYNLGNHKDAIQDFSEAILLDSTMDIFYYYRGLTYYDMESFNAALNDFSSAIKLNGSNTDALLYHSKCLFKSQNYSSAISDLDELVKMKPDNVTYIYYRGNAKYYKGDMIGALQDFNTILYSSADFAPAYYGRALAYIASDSLESACTDLKKANELGYSVDAEMLTKYCK
jgi:protein O-mannosyl-transferase